MEETLVSGSDVLVSLAKLLSMRIAPQPNSMTTWQDHLSSWLAHGQPLLPQDSQIRN